MTCPFDRETLAAYGNDDLPGALRQATEEHLQTCQACRLVVEQYQEGAEALATAVAAVSLPAGLSQPLPARRPAWPMWATAAAVIAGLVFALQLPAVAEAWRALQVTFWGQAQIEEHIEVMREMQYGDTIRDGVPYETVEQAAEKYRRPLAVPTYLPEGYNLRFVAVEARAPWARQDYFISSTYTPLMIMQAPARHTMSVQYLEGDQPQTVTVNGREGYIRETSLHVNYDGTYQIRGDAYRSLTFEWNGDVVVIVSQSIGYPQYVERLSTEELVKIAESIVSVK
jgi:hypothetical protein